MGSIVSTIVSSTRCYILARIHVYIARILDCPLMCTPSGKSSPLDTLSVAGILGGDEAVSAMATVHVCENRSWLGWYNSPGSYQIAKQFRLISKPRFSASFSPSLSVHADLATLFEPDASKGLKFRAAHSGTIIEETGRLAALFMEECAAREGKVVEGRKSQTVSVTIAELKHVPPPQMHPRRINTHSPLFATIPIAVSVTTCMICGVFDDWYSSLLILFGILMNGISCLVIGSAKLVFTHPDTPEGCPPGDGILYSSKEIVLLGGDEGAVNSISRGKFSLNFSSERHHRNIGWCSVLLNIQFVAQLLIVPQCSPLGQIMFGTSLAVSWIYNSWLSSLDKEELQRVILLNSVLKKPVLTRYSFGSRTAAVVFVLLVLQQKNPTRILNELLPNETKVWDTWKEMIVQRLRDKNKLKFVDTDWWLDGYTQRERSLLETLYGDAQVAYGAYIEHVAPKLK